MYFAKEAWYSSRKVYAVPDDEGLQYVYIAKVLVGKYTKGEEGLIVPPPIDASNPNIRYDSVVDNVTKPLIYVVFYDYQHYPEYLITFKGEKKIHIAVVSKTISVLRGLECWVWLFANKGQMNAYRSRCESIGNRSDHSRNKRLSPLVKFDCKLHNNTKNLVQ